jgi:hypothetical protein
VPALAACAGRSLSGVVNNSHRSFGKWTGRVLIKRLAMSAFGQHRTLVGRHRMSAVSSLLRMQKAYSLSLSNAAAK